MKWVITTVGTSIFENLLREGKLSESDWDAVMGLDFSHWGEVEEERKRLRKEAAEALRENPFKLSAELHSLIKIHERKGEELGVILLASDSVSSALAAFLIKEFLEKNLNDKFPEVKFDPERNVISNLQVINKTNFLKEGLKGLIEFLEWVKKTYTAQEIAVNITGGFKATIPYITIFANLNGISLYYIFEKTEELIEIPPLPVQIDREFIKAYWEFLKKLEGTIEDFRSFKFQNPELVSKLSAFIWEDGNEATLSPIGEMFLRKIEEEYFILYATREVIDEINKNSFLRQQIQKDFWKEELRRKKTREEKGHLVYRDGNLRLYYLERGQGEDKKIYLYKFFQEKGGHEDHVRYLSSVKVPNEEELKNKTQKIELEKL